MADLTPRESEVADLLAEGLSNRQIGERLFISERTAEVHVDNIRRKLGFGSRFQVAAWVAERRAASAPVAPGEAERETRPETPPAPRRSSRARIAVGAAVAGVAVVVGVALAVVGSGQRRAVITIAEGPGGPAGLSRPTAVAVDAAGDLYVVDGNRILRFTPARASSVVAGALQPGSSGDGGPATSALLNGPRALAVDADGNLYIADTANNTIRRIGRDGVITRVAGSGTAGFDGDGGPALQGRLHGPAGLVLGFGRSIYLADTANQRVRMVAEDGTITTIAGAGEPGYAGDGGTATQALFDEPQGLAFDAEGNLYVADSLNDRIRRVDLSGTITTVAGTGGAGFSGDGGLATLAELNLGQGPVNGASQALAVDDTGDVFVADANNFRVRELDHRGIMTTVAGRGPGGPSRVGGPAVSARLDLPLGVTVDPAGDLFIAAGSRIRRVGLSATRSG